MKTTLIIALIFLFGIFFGYIDILPKILLENDISYYILVLLVFTVGLTIGSDKRNVRIFKNFQIRILLIPISAIIGTLLFSALSSFFLKNYSIKECMAVGAGFGYYSLSSLILTQIHSSELGVIALMSNIIRESFTLLFAPLIARMFGKIAVITSGGATSMDTTLPMVSKYAGKSYVIISVFNGVILTLLVPIIIRIIFWF